MIEIENLTKTYKRFQKQAGFLGSVGSLFKRQFIEKTAISQFNLTIERGEFVGLIGQNGAGKTTLIKMMTGIIAPTSGRISVMGYYPNKLKNSFKKQYAVVMGQKSQLFFDLTPEDTFQLFKILYDIPDKEYKKNLNFFVDLFDVSDYLNVQVRTLSLGERMKMELIVALLHNPEILFLDEPTIGLDVVAQKQIRSFLKEVNETKKTTILLTSHYMEDIKSLCKRSLMIEKGEKIYDGLTETLFKQIQKFKKITVNFDTEKRIILPDDCQVLEENRYKITFMAPKAEVLGIVKDLFSTYDLKEVSIEDEDLGTAIERIYKKGAQRHEEIF